MGTANPESTIVFFKAGGHNHDGINSSQLDRNIYSLFDFNLSTNAVTSNSDINYYRNINKQNFEYYIGDVISRQTISPAGITFSNTQSFVGLNMFQPTIRGGTNSSIYFDYIGTYSALAMNTESIEIITPTIHVQEILYFILQPPSGSNVRVWANLRTGAVSSNIGITASNEIIVSSSMRELKNNIAPIQDGVGLLKLLNPVNFEWKPEPDASEVAAFMNASDRRFGFIVEEIEAIDRGLVQYRYTGPEVENADDMFLSNSYFSLQHYDSAGLIAILTSALQNAIERIENLEQQVAGG